MQRGGKAKGKKRDNSQSDITCENCDKLGHAKPDCYFKGGGKEGQAPWQKKQTKDTKTAVVAEDDDEGDLFAFTCTSVYAAMAEQLDLPKSKLGTCINSGASRDYCPDRAKFTNYKPVQREITTADGRTLTAVGVGDLQLELPNGSGKTKTIFKNAIHAPEMAFTLISISRLDKAGYSITFNKGMCTIKKKTTLTATDSTK